MSGFLLTRLHRRHTQIRERLNLLARQLDGLEAGRQPGFAEMDYLLEGLTGSVERHHAQSEDQLLDRLTKRAPEYAEMVTGLRDQHRRAIACGEQVRTMAEAARDGHIVRRDQLVRTGRRFVSQFRTLLDREENELFPLLYQSLRRSDWVEITRRCQSEARPPAEPRDDDGFTTVTGNLVCPRSRGTNAETRWSGNSHKVAETRGGEP